MERIEESIEVDVPVRTCYNQWTQFESFPEFMEGVKEVRQIDDRRCQWTAEIGGKEKSWEAEIYRQVPDREIAWRATSGAMNQGRVSFTELGPNKCRFNLVIEYDPQGPVENVGDALGVVKARVKGDAKRFKEFIESRKQETGEWRGKIQGGQVDKKGRPTTAETTATGGSSTGSSGGTPGQERGRRSF